MGFAPHSEYRSPLPDPLPRRRKRASVRQIKEWIRLHKQMMGGMGDAHAYGKLDQLKRDLRAAQARARRRKKKRDKRAHELMLALRGHLNSGGR